MSSELFKTSREGFERVGFPARALNLPVRDRFPFRTATFMGGSTQLEFRE